MTRHVLADRRRKLVREGVLRRVPYHVRLKRYEYILTHDNTELRRLLDQTDPGRGGRTGRLRDLVRT